MASTKQRQALAKINRKIAQMNASTATIHTTLVKDVVSLQNKINIRLAGTIQLGVMFSEFVEDYRASGDLFRTSDGDFFNEEGAERTSYALNYNGKDAGFMTLRHETNDEIPTEIEIVYIRPEFRGLNLSSAFYRWAISEKSAQNIEVTFRRVRDNIAYWRAIGFNYFKLLPDQTGSLVAVVMLDTTEGNDLNPFVLKTAREHMNIEAGKFRKLYDIFG